MTLPSKEAVARRLVWHLTEDEDGCWIYWTQSKRRHPYMSLRAAGKPRTVTVARVAAWLWLDFDLDSPLEVLHQCDKPRCFNPDCLYIGTQKDNVRDAVRRGRWTQGSTISSRACALKGEYHPGAKLTNQKVADIRAKAASGESRRRIAKEYGISTITVGNIVRHQSWKHVP